MLTRILALSLVAIHVSAEPIPDRGKIIFDSPTQGQFRFAGPVGDRIQANAERWLLRAPQANPGMLEMFRVRDRRPEPQIVPWAGEFVGKYLISLIQALRLTDDPRLTEQAAEVVGAFISTQAEDGYLGPFPRRDRLLKHWDLWGHYHALQALTMWRQHSGDAASLAAARKAADLICATYLDTGRRVSEAGDSEMNMAILTGMAALHRLTGEARYLRMAREVEKDWEKAGDYLRAGLDGREYYQGPKPRWESLHDLQGLAELWRITGESKYREAFIHHWRSIRRWDRRNSGAFSSGEQATGNPYAPTAIETCCTVAWIALTIDYLKLTGDPLGADELELSTLNGGLGSQHADGSWWTYNTPMDGIREASAHSIVFQARAGTPELNCCSVNGPRILGALSEWAVMMAEKALIVNCYLPCTFKVPTAAGEFAAKLSVHYPQECSQTLTVTSNNERELAIRLRIPAWTKETKVKANFPGVPKTAPGGSYLEISRQWKAGDEVHLEFDPGIRPVAGANEAASLVSLYRGPLLLAYDQSVNAFDEDKLPVVDLKKLSQSRIVTPSITDSPASVSPWLLVEVPTSEGTLRLVDFASAGQNGTRYRSWLPATPPPPPPALTTHPRDGERIRPGSAQFVWRTTRNLPNLQFRLEIASDPEFTQHLFLAPPTTTRRATVDLSKLPPGNQQRWWRVIAVAPQGETAADIPAATFTMDPAAAPQLLPPSGKIGPLGECISHRLRNDEKPLFGEMVSGNCEQRTPEGTKLNGRDQSLVYALPWPEGDFTVALRVRIHEMPQGRMGQVFSAWSASMDDPLRLTIEEGQINARVESGKTFATPKIKIGVGEWRHLAAVKKDATLELFIDGKSAGSCAVPAFLPTAAQDCAVGGNPHFGGNEFLAATFADFGVWDRALPTEEIVRLSSP